LEPEPLTRDEPAGPSTAGAPAARGLSFGGLTEFLGRSGADAAAPLAPGARLGDVTIVRLLGQGGMGRVYEALQGMPCRTVAVKVMRPGMLSAAAARRFEHEAHVLGRLNHPGIARIYSVGTQPVGDGVVPYFVMEFVEDARPITDYAAAHRLPDRDRLALFREACAAVAHGHRKGVIHRDLKPGNILVDAAGRPKVIDFGVARCTDSDVAVTTLHTDAGQLVGTLSSMAPEQFSGSSDDLDVRADVYALGVVLYELLAGRPPHDVARLPVYDVARIVREVEPPRLASLEPRLRGDLDTIVATCLAKDRARRYSSAAELEADLGRHLRGEPIAVSPPGLVDAVVRLARRHRAAALAAAAVLATLLAGIVGVSLFAVRAERERAAAVRERERADAATREALGALFVANLRALRAGVDSGNLRPARQSLARNLAILGGRPTLETRILAARLDDALVVVSLPGREVDDLAFGPAGDVLGVAAFTPGPPTGHERVQPNAYRNTSTAGRRAVDLLFFSVDGLHRCLPVEPRADLWVAAWRGGAPDPSAAAPDAGATLATSPDGRRAAVHRGDGRVHVVDLHDADSGVTLAEQQGRVTRAAFGPDGSRIALVTPDGRLGLWDAEAGRLLARTDADVAQFTFSPDGSCLATVTPARDRRGTDEVRFLDARDGRSLAAVQQARAAWKGQHAPLFAFSPDGRRVATATAAHTLDVREVATGAVVGSLAGHSAPITALAFSPDGAHLASGAVNGHLRLCDPAAREWERTLSGHEASVTAIAFRGAGETFATGSQDGTVRVWSRAAREPLAVLPGVGGAAALAFSPCGRWLAVAPRGAGGVELWNPRTVERVHRLPGPTDEVGHLAFSPDGGLVAAAGAAVRVWRAATGEPLAPLADQPPDTMAISFSPDGTRLLATSRGGLLTIWDCSSGSRCLAASVGRAVPADGAGAVFGLGGGRVAHAGNTLLDAVTGAVAARLPPQGLVTCLAASPDGRTLATGMAFGSVSLTEFATGRRRPIFAAHAAAVRAIAFDAGGSRVATGSLDGTVRLWDVSSGAAKGVFVGHEGGVERVIFSPDGRRIVTGATDGTARIWDVEGGHELLSLPGQSDRPAALDLSPDGSCVVTAAPDGAVRIWGLSNAEIVTARQAVADRP